MPQASLGMIYPRDRDTIPTSLKPTPVGGQLVRQIRTCSFESGAQCF